MDGKHAENGPVLIATRPKPAVWVFSSSPWVLAQQLLVQMSIGSSATQARVASRTTLVAMERAAEEGAVSCSCVMHSMSVRQRNHLRALATPHAEPLVLLSSIDVRAWQSINGVSETCGTAVFWDSIS